ncbi:MAG: single-stranded-DNA-specific exonuclease RecJ [Gammaproteobacteria bacterium]
MKSRILQRPSPHSAELLPKALHPVLRRVYAARGIKNQTDLDYRLGQLLPPQTLSGLSAAADLIINHIKSDGHIVIVGDFDADGATSTVVALRGLRMLGARDVSYLVPNRFEYGYGLTPEIVELAMQRDPDLLITVDNGIASYEGVAKARAAGIDVLVTDHHLPGLKLPDANVIVNPNLQGEDFASKSLAGVGVIFYVIMAVRRRMREQNSFSTDDFPEPNLGSLLAYVALGTVADVVILDRNNRILVEQGLRRIRTGDCSAGLLELINVAGKIRTSLTATDLAFGVAPRLNAAGRMDDMTHGIECLLTNDATLAKQLTMQLDRLNCERRDVEKNMHADAENLLRQREWNTEDGMPAALVLHDPGWHVGVVGLLASRIKDTTNRPVIAFADQEVDELKGSARSVPGFHIRDALHKLATTRPDLLQKFGGHAMAAGLSLKKSKLDEFTQEFTAIALDQLGHQEAGKVYFSDGGLSERELTLELAEILQFAGPWGQGFPEPLFDNKFEVVDWRVVGERHLKMTLRPCNTQHEIAAIAFNAEQPFDPGTRITAVYRLGVNDYRGTRQAQLVIEYFESAQD